MARIGLNLRIKDNYAFFCPESRLHLTRSNPVGITDRVTSSILRGLKAKTLIDIDALEAKRNEEIVKENKPETNKVEDKKEVKVEETAKEAVAETEAPVKEEKAAPSTKKGRKKTEE